MKNFRFPRRAIAAAIALTLAPAAPLLMYQPQALAANHPERQWLVKESPHFLMHYYPGIEKTAARVLAAAEAAYPKLAADFGVKSIPNRIPLILTQDSFFNGEAEPIKDRITLDPVLASSSVIGTERFVAHELAHVMTFQSVNTGVKLAQLNSLGGLPTWFLEGVAQYTSEYWYPSNDRMLRLHTLENSLLTTSERVNFRLLGVHAGAAGYNEGYALCRYMFDTYGRDKVAVLMKNLKNGERSFEQAVEATFGQTMTAIDAGWRQSLRESYKKQVKGIQAEVPGAKKLVATHAGEVNVSPRVSPDGKQLAYLTSRYQDSFLYLRGNVMGFLSLYVADADGRNAKMVPIGKGAANAFIWSSDSKKLVYSRVVGDKLGNPTFDLFAYDLEKRTNTRLTNGEGVNGMAWKPGTGEVLFVSVDDGRNAVKAVNTSTRKVRTVMAAKGDTQYREPAWSPAGDKVALVTFEPGAPGNLAVLDPESGRLSELTRPQPRVADSAPNWTPDGSRVVFTSDRGGMTNLYEVALATRATRQLTNTYRGAETPALTPDGTFVYYTSFKAKGSEIYRLPLASPSAAKGARAVSGALKGGNEEEVALPDARAASQALKQTKEALQAAEAAAPAPKGLGAGPQVATAPEKPLFTPQGLPKAIDLLDEGLKGAKPYQPTLTNDILVPQMTSDEKGQQVGLAGTYSDILNKHQLAFDVRYGLMSQRFSYMFQYMNRMLGSSWMVSLYDSPLVALSPDIGQNGVAIMDSLYFQRQRGASLGIQTPLGSGRSIFTGLNLGYLDTLVGPRAGDYGQLRTGPHNTISLGYTEQNVTNTIDGDINPTDGYRVMAASTLSSGLIGSGFDYSQFLVSGERYFSIIPDLRHNLTWRWNAGMINGDAPVPFLLGGAVGSSPIFALRGYAVGAFAGNRIATTGLEYTAPIFTHLDKMVGPLYLDRLYIAGFSDVGAAWDSGSQANPFASAGLELRLRTTVMGRQMLTFRLGLAKKLGSADAPGFYITF